MTYDLFLNILVYTLIPVVAVIIGAAFAAQMNPSPALESAVQHLAAGVVFAAAAVEVLPLVKHQASLAATAIGGLAGLATMLVIKEIGSRWKGPAGLVGLTAIDLLVDGLVLGLAFLAGEKAGTLLAVALTLEVLFLGMALTKELRDAGQTAAKAILVTGALAFFLPLGGFAALPVATLSPAVISGFLSFGLVALLYLVIEELLVEAHEQEEGPWVTAMFFIGFLALLLLEEAIA